MGEVKHTPVPWHRRIGRVGNGTPASQHEQICNDEGIAVVMLEHDGCADGAANIEFIVRAVNAHEDLLNIVKAVVFLESMVPELKPMLAPLFNDARAALAKVSP